jgi:hypothetical protein
MVTSKQRDIYRLIRYDYYHAGRLLHLMGNFQSAGIMLGYTIETTMKAGLMEVMPEERWCDKILKSHDVRHIFRKCVGLGLFDDVAVSKDFLEHVNNNFQRYPSQMKEIVEHAEKSNIVLGNSVDWAYYYDDLVVQLDQHLLRRTSDPSISIIYHAIRVLETRYARDILRENAFALLRFNEYAVLIRRNMPEREDLRKQIEDNLSRGSIFYWNPDSPRMMTYADIIDIAKRYSAKAFELPKWTVAKKNARSE